jgi:hypothetical protein
MERALSTVEGYRAQEAISQPEYSGITTAPTDSIRVHHDMYFVPETLKCTKYCYPTVVELLVTCTIHRDQKCDTCEQVGRIRCRNCGDGFESQGRVKMIEKRQATQR